MAKVSALMPALSKTTGASPDLVNKAASRRAHLQNIARVYAIAKIRADNPVRLSFDAYPVGSGIRLA